MIYAIADRQGNVKFGISRAPNGRFMELQTGNADRLEFVGAIETEDDRQVEKHIHCCLGSLGLRKNGEWFSPSIATTLIAQAIQSGGGAEQVAQLAMNMYCFLHPSHRRFVTLRNAGMPREEAFQLCRDELSRISR